MKKKTQRKLKKALRTAGKALKQLEPALGGRAGALAAGGITAGGLLFAAARDPRIQESARELASAVSDFVKRSALGTLRKDEASSIERH